MTDHSPRAVLCLCGSWAQRELEELCQGPKGHTACSELGYKLGLDALGDARLSALPGKPC